MQSIYGVARTQLRVQSADLIVDSRVPLSLAKCAKLLANYANGPATNPTLIWHLWQEFRHGSLEPVMNFSECNAECRWICAHIATVPTERRTGCRHLSRKSCIVAFLSGGRR